MDSPSRQTGPSKWFDPDGLKGAVIVGVFATLLGLFRQLHEPGWPTDIDQLHVAARALLSGANPYDVVGPGRQFEWPWPLFYPLTAVVLTVPLAPFPLPVARVLFAAISGTLFGYAITRGGSFWRLPFCLGAAFMVCVWWRQWSLLITTAFFVPLAMIFVFAKPNFAPAFIAGIKSRRQLMFVVGGGLAILAAALLVRPDWLRNWVAALMTKQFVSAPISNPGGFLLLLALLRWRRAEARVFTLLVCAPQTPSFYDLVPLIVIPRTLRETSVLSLLTSILFCIAVSLGPYESFNDFAHTLERWAVWVVYIPALVMLLRRPNAADDAPADPRRERRTWRTRIEALPRLDFWLLLLNGVFAAAFMWGFLVTRRV